MTEVAALPPAIEAEAPEVGEKVLGLSREDRRLIQRALNDQGHKAGVEDGLFGRGTREAITSWQVASQAKATGYLAAEFDKDHLPKSLDIWRGGVVPPGGDWHDVAFGISWTRNRDTACWFAVCHWGNRIKGEPVVLKQPIERRYVLAHFTGRGEDEIVTTTRRRTEVDGSLKNWRIVAERYGDQIRAEERARLKALRIARRQRQT